MSIRKDTWFEGSRWTLEEILKFTYLWCQDLVQRQIAHELGFPAQSGVDWDNFCREVCEVTLLENSERIGGQNTIHKPIRQHEDRSRETQYFVFTRID